jgi:hypothetical protein
MVVTTDLNQNMDLIQITAKSGVPLIEPATYPKNGLSLIHGSGRIDQPNAISHGLEPRR